MMWPHMISALALGARLIAYDGSPFYPDVRGFLRFISDQRVTMFGTSPRFLSELQKADILPCEFILSSIDLTATLSTCDRR